MLSIEKLDQVDLLYKWSKQAQDKSINDNKVVIDARITEIT